MVFQFKDENMTIKHLGFILQVKALKENILHIVETFDNRTVQQDILCYKTEKLMKADINKLFKELQDYSKRLEDISDKSPSGYSGGFDGEEAGEE